MPAEEDAPAEGWDPVEGTPVEEENHVEEESHVEDGTPAEGTIRSHSYLVSLLFCCSAIPTFGYIFNVFSRGPDPRSLAWPAPIPHRVGRVWPRETKTRESLSRETNGGGREMSPLLYS